MAVNKVVMNTENGAKTLIDISDSTVAPNKMLKGTVAYGANGEKVNGTIETVATAPLFMSSDLYDGAIVINAETNQEEGYVMRGGYQESRMIYLSANGNTATVTDGVVSLSKKVADIIGNVDASKNIILSGDLAEGTYTFNYTDKDGNIKNVGGLVIGGSPAYTNQIPISITSSKTLFVGTNGEKGYKTGYRLSLSSGGESAQTGTEVTGFIPVTKESVIRIKNIAYSGDTTRGVVGYDANFAKLTLGNGINLNSLFDAYGYDDGNGVRRSQRLRSHANFDSDDIKYIRLCSTDINENSILTVDQEIV